jgi:radical SAM superfamily enzyme YgiQ (UPF0313 family)
MKILFVMVREENIDPLNVELLSALARRDGHETFLSFVERGEVEGDMSRIRPDLVAFSAKTGESNVFFRVNADLRQRFGDNYLSVMGGPHPTFNAARMRLRWEDLEIFGRQNKDANALPPEDTQLDFLAVGEADESWPALLNAVAGGDSPDVIPGIVTRTNRQPDGTVPIGQRTNFLDDLPFHDRELVYTRTQLQHFGMRTFIATRGCPYPCSYCFNARFNQLYKGKGKTINRYSVDRLLEELLDIKTKWPTQFIKFYDDIFTLRVDDWLLEFAEKYPKVIGLPFHCLTRCDLVRKDPDLIPVLKKAGIHSITMSIESGSEFIRKYIFKRPMKESDIRFAFDLCHQHGIKTFSNTILAVPTPVAPDPDSADFESEAVALIEDLERHFPIKTEQMREQINGGGPLSSVARQSLTEQFESLGLRRNMIDYDVESVDLNVNCRVTSGEFVHLSPYPGTPLNQYTIDVGAFDGDFESLHETFQAASPFSCFTDEEKMQQLNLCFLGVPLLVFPRLRNLVVNHLVPKKLTKLYFFIYFMVRGYVLGMRIYPMRYSYRQLFGKIKASFTRESMKHFAPVKTRSEDEATSDGAPSDVLGGPWRS